MVSLQGQFNCVRTWSTSRSSGVCYRVVWWNYTDVSREPTDVGMCPNQHGVAIRKTAVILNFVICSCFIVYLTTACKFYNVQSFTQENAVDLHSVDSPVTLVTAVDRKRTDRIKNISLYHRLLSQLPLVATALTTQNTTEITVLSHKHKTRLHFTLQ
jgi:hypothetical protein